MPKIPTFTAQARPTAEVGSIQSDIKIDPTKTVAAGLSSIAGSVQNYYIKKRNAEEKLIADNIIKDLESESDKIVYSQKDNIVEEDALNNYYEKFGSIRQQKLSTVNNRRIKELVESGTSLNNTENIYNLKKNSFEALEKGSLINVNNKITSLMGKYATTDSETLKEAYKKQTELEITTYANDVGLPKNVLEKKLKALEKDFFLADMRQLVGGVVGAEHIKELDRILGGTEVIEDKDFGTGIYNIYNEKISELTIKGDPNADYDRAIELTNELEKFERPNGYKVSNGELSIKIDSLKEKVLTEKLQHDGLMQKQGDNKLFYSYSNNLKKALIESIADPFGAPELQDRLSAAEIESDYDKAIKQYLIANPNDSLQDKEQFSRSLIYSLRNIHDDIKLSKVNSSILDSNRFDFQEEYQRVIKDAKSLQDGTLDEVTLGRYKTRAKRNGFVIETTTGKDAKGSPTIVKTGDVKAFLNQYLPILKSQFSTTNTGQ